jgi:hypothetical protein
VEWVYIVLEGIKRESLIQREIKMHDVDWRLGFGGVNCILREFVEIVKRHHDLQSNKRRCSDMWRTMWRTETIDRKEENKR